jgi:membrane-associated protein
MNNLLFNLDQWMQYHTAAHPIIAIVIFFGIVFSESAFFPLAPLLPGDGLLFGVGVLAASGALNIWVTLVVLIFAGVLGNWVAYSLGLRFGPTIVHKVKWLHTGNYNRAHEFYRIYGAKALFYSRFVPVVRALVPLVAGIAKMEPRAFRRYNILSVAIWVLSIVWAAYFLGDIPWIRHNFLWIIMGIAAMSLVPAILVAIQKMKRKL